MICRTEEFVPPPEVLPFRKLSIVTWPGGGSGGWEEEVEG